MTHDEFYIEIAKTVSKKSKDPSKKVGCVIEKDGRILSIGYNGAPRTFDDNLLPLANSENLLTSKNTFIVHAELNAILNYGGSLRDLQGATLYVTLSPCHECAKAIAQLGIKKVIYIEQYSQDVYDAAKYIFETCGVYLEKWSES